MDPIDKAIATAQAPKAYQATQIAHPLASGRQVVIALPADFTDRELHEAMGWMQAEGWATFVQVRSQRAPGLLIPAGALPTV